MAAVLIIAIVVFVIWGCNRGGSGNSHYPRETIKKDNSAPAVHNKPSAPACAPSQKISVIPNRISSAPNLNVSLIEGKYRFFENHYVNGKEYSFGFPKENCTDKRVWFGVGNKEIERISYDEAMRRIEGKSYISNQTKYISSSSHNVGYCSNCGKKLRGNIYKKHCTECYHNGFR